MLQFIKLQIAFYAINILPAIGAAIAGAVVQGAFNQRTSSRQMGFQERMSSSSHQREVKDLRLAGLNPILSSKYGGSSTPGGASIPAPQISNAISSAVQAARSKAEIANLKADTVKKGAETAVTQATKKIVDENLHTAKAAAAAADTEKAIDDSTYGKVIRYIMRLNPLTGGAKNIKPPSRIIISK